MPPSFLILSRANAATCEPRGAEVCISINDPGDLPVELCSRFKSVLRLTFSDIGEASRLHQPGDRLFGAEHAMQTIEFIARWHDVEQVVIHCTAAMTRSPGLALGICELQRWPVEELERTDPSWNRWVRKELMRVGRTIRVARNA